MDYTEKDLPVVLKETEIVTERISSCQATCNSCAFSFFLTRIVDQPLICPRCGARALLCVQ